MQSFVEIRKIQSLKSNSRPRRKRPRKHQRSPLPRHPDIHTGPIRLLGTNLLRRDGAINRIPALRRPYQFQRRRRTFVDRRTHGTVLRRRDRERGGEGFGRGIGQVGDGRVERVGGCGG